MGLQPVRPAGRQNTPTRKKPVQVKNLSGVGFMAGVPYVWGWNALGQAGDGTTATPKLLPVRASGLSA
jgi:hypothetical protein